MEIYVINPDNNKPIPIDEWKKESNPTRAEFVAIRIDGGTLIIKKNLLGRHTFEEAEKACANLDPIGEARFRMPTRKECIDIYDARFQGLDEAIELVCGDPLTCCIWTCERDTDPRFNVDYAWNFSGYNGGLLISSVYGAYQVGAVSLL